MKKSLVGVFLGVLVGAGLCFADEAQDARQIKQYLENVLGSGVQVNITRDTVTPPAQQRRRTQTNPKLATQKSTQTASQKSWRYDTTETLTQLEAVEGPRSVTVVYPSNTSAVDEDTPVGTRYTPAEVEILVASLLGIKANEKLVVQAYTPPPPIAFAQVKPPQIWLWAVACMSFGVFLGLGVAFYWRKRQQQKKIAYNALHDNSTLAYPLHHRSEETVSYAPELQ